MGLTGCATAGSRVAGPLPVIAPPVTPPGAPPFCGELLGGVVGAGFTTAEPEVAAPLESAVPGAEPAEDWASRGKASDASAARLAMAKFGNFAFIPLATGARGTARLRIGPESAIRDMPQLRFLHDLKAAE